MNREVSPTRARHAFFSTVIIAVALVLPARASSDRIPSSDAQAAFKSVTVIGDSLSDTGRLFRATGVPPAPYFQGRMSNGPLWVEYFSPRAGLVYDPLDNFSWAGATTGQGNAFGGGLPGMKNELDEVLSLWNGVDKKSLHVVFGGANDFFRILVNGENPEVVIPEAIGNIISIVTQLRAKGARYIVVVDLPDIGLTPRARSGGPALAGGATYLSVVFNTLLNRALDQADPAVIRVSAFTLLNRIVAQPAAYGFENVTAPGIASGGNGDGYLFWDDIHPTTRAHALVAEAVFDAVQAAGLVTTRREYQGVALR